MRSVSVSSSWRFHEKTSLLLTALLCATTAQADHTTNPSGVALVGSLQSELSADACGDWQPECAFTELLNVPGTTLWQATYTVPAGFYEWKVALNDSWDENYGDGPGADNFQLDLTESRDIILSFHGQSLTVAHISNASRLIRAESIYVVLGGGTQIV